MNACASCACSGVAVLPVPIAHTGSYATTSSLVRLGSARPAAAARPRSRRARAPASSLADAGDHAQARLERGSARRRATSRRSRRSAGAARSGRRSRRDAELEQHRRRDLAGERALVLPVHVLRGDRDSVRPAPARRRRARRTAGRPRRRRRRARQRSRRPRQNAAVSARRLVHLPVAGDQHQAPPSAAGIAATPGSSLPSSSSSARAAAGRDPGDPVGEAELLQRPDRVGAADDRVRVGARATAAATAFVPSAKRGHSKTPIGPFQKIVFAVAIRSGEARRGSRARCRGRASPRAPRRTARPCDSASGSNAAAATTSTGSSTGEVERVLVAELLGHLAADEHGVGPPAEVAQDAELVLDLRAARDDHERPLDLAEQPAELLELALEQQARVRAAAGARRASVDACARCAEPNASFDVEVAPARRARCAKLGVVLRLAAGRSACSRARGCARRASSSRSRVGDRRHRELRGRGPFGRPRCEQTRTSAAPALEQQLRASAARRGCACRRRPGRPRAARSGRRGRARACRATSASRTERGGAFDVRRSPRPRPAASAPIFATRSTSRQL